MTTTQLKIIAALCMLIDHIAAFIPNIPVWFHWIGRVSAPIFCFCLAWGFFHTRDRKLFLKRLYILSVSMGLLNVMISMLHIKGSTHVENNILSTFFIAVLIIFIIDLYLVNQEKGKHVIKLFIILQVSCTLLFILLAVLVDLNTFIIEQLMGAVTANIFTCEGGPPFVVLIVILYYTKHNQKKLILSYTSFWLLYTLFYVTDFVPRIYMHLGRVLPNSLVDVSSIIPSILGMSWIPTYHQPWYFVLDYRWMIIFALPFMLVYNGQKGKGLKYFFYMFYPTHIYILFLIGVLL